jgi:hypothetical protein
VVSSDASLVEAQIELSAVDKGSLYELLRTSDRATRARPAAFGGLG